MSGIEDALRIALEAHAGQLDKAGKPYILHPLRLMMKFEDPDQRMVALLHDVLEDSDVSAADLQARGFSREIVEAVLCLTRQRDESYDGFIARIMPNALARAVKIEDIRDNMDLSRLPVIGEKDLERVKKYHKALLDLQGVQHQSTKAISNHDSGAGRWG